MTNVYAYEQIDNLIVDLSYNTSKDVGITGMFANPLHSGHIELLKGCVSKCDVVIVALNNDEMCIKKSGYSFMSWKDRTSILSALKYVDWIIENPYPTMVELLDSFPEQYIKYYLKGGDVTEETLLQAEKDACRKKNIKIIYNTGGNKSQSSSSILESYWSYRQKQHEFTDCMNKLKDI